jgi:radical SAM protein with 4Fe4S-binding SPASM domain
MIGNAAQADKGTAIGLDAVDSRLLTSPLPQILWIELTSRCPLDCVFCSRRLTRGPGEDMDFGLFTSLLRQLREPEIIRLNYSGESANYPRLPDAIRAARATGAWTELVTALVSAPNDLLPALIQNGLCRLTISIHGLDPSRFAQIYGNGSAKRIKQHIIRLVELKQSMRGRGPRLDFAFVAMDRNLDELPAIADFARHLGIQEIAVHPILCREPGIDGFSSEVSKGRMTPGFRSRLSEQVAKVQGQFTELSLRIENPDSLPCPDLGPVPVPFPDLLPPHARISTCDQNPWDTLHILANGDVVSCEVRDRLVLGNLHRHSLEAIWQGDTYHAFRRQYRMGSDPHCRGCLWKMAYAPSMIRPAIQPGPWPGHQLPRGWHLAGESGHIWSKPKSLALISKARGSSRLTIRGILPPASGWRPNRLTIRCNGTVVKRVFNMSGKFMDFEVHADVSRYRGSLLYLDLATARTFVPAIEAGGKDIRKLGFALREVRID